MATSLPRCPLATSPHPPKPSPLPKPHRHPRLLPFKRPSPAANLSVASAYRVTIEHEGETRSLDVEPDESILDRALGEGLPVPHDCRLGVCMTCPARLLSGEVDQSEGMLSEDVVDRGHALLCVAHLRSDCTMRTVPEKELLSLQLATTNGFSCRGRLLVLEFG